MLTVLSNGAGQDSAAMWSLWKHDFTFAMEYAPEDLLIIFSDTGSEHPETYVYVEEFKAEARERGVEFVHIVPEMGYHGDGWHSLDQQMDKNTTVFSKAFPKSCTDNLKLKPIYRFLSDWIQKKYGLPPLQKKYRGKAPLVAYAEKYGKISMLLGIARGEEKRISKHVNRPKWQQLSVSHRYPLVDLGMNRADCQKYLRDHNDTVPWPSCCLKCPFANLPELLYLEMEFPEVYKDWCRQEKAKMDRNKHKEKNLAVWGTTKTLPEMLEIAKEKHGNMTAAEVREYRFTHGHCNMSTY